MNLFNITGILVPEIVLVTFSFSVLLMDLPILRRQGVEARHRLLGQFAAAGLIMVFAAYLTHLVNPINLKLQLDRLPLPLGEGSYFVESPLNVIFKMLIVVLALIAVLMGLRTPYSSHVGEYYGLILFTVLGMVFLISSEDLLMIFVSLEIVSLSLYVLTAFQKGAQRSVESGMKYFVFGGLSAAFLLFGLSYIFGATGQTGLNAISQVLSSGQAAGSMTMLHLGILFTLVGFGFKIAAVPFHLWAPDAYEGAPVPVTALIATGSKVASFFALTKLLLAGLLGASGKVLSWPASWQAGWAVTIIVMAVLSMGLGNLAALMQNNVKRLLAYSSVAHGGYILVAFTAINTLGLPSSISKSSIYFYILIYALTNIGLFGVLNALASKVGGDDFEHFSGVARRAPFLSLLMLIFILSLAGIPPLAGFFGKFYLFASAIDADPQNLGLLWLVAFAIAMSAVSLYYYLKLAKQMYVVAPLDSQNLEISPGISTVLGLVCLSVLLLGVFPGDVIQLFQSLK